jgi:hypothetical protein
MTTPSIPDYIMQAAEDVADAVLKSAGSGFQYYMPSSKEKIIAAAAAFLMAERERDQWQDISTAPKDGTVIDVWVSHPDRAGGGYRQAFVKWERGEWVDLVNRYAPVEGHFNPVTGTPVIRVTHWMTLPAPPTGKGE